MIETLLDALVLAWGLLRRMLPLLILGVIAAEFIIAMGYVNKLSFLARPITRFSHLKHECGVSFLMAFGSGVAAYATLAKYREEGLISKKEMFLAAMINSFPGVLLHWRPNATSAYPLTWSHRSCLLFTLRSDRSGKNSAPDGCQPNLIADAP